MNNYINKINAKGDLEFEQGKPQLLIDIIDLKRAKILLKGEDLARYIERVNLPVTIGRGLSESIQAAQCGEITTCWVNESTNTIYGVITPTGKKKNVLNDILLNMKCGDSFKIRTCGELAGSKPTHLIKPLYLSIDFGY